MDHRLILIGCGGLGREVYSYLTDFDSKETGWEFAGFLDGNPEALIDLPGYGEILGDPETYQPQSGDRFVCCLGDPSTRMRVTEQLKARGAKFVNLIHPSAIVSPRAQVGNGATIAPFCVVSPEVTIEDDVLINAHVGVGHDAVIGRGCTLSSFVNVTGYVKLDSGVFIGSHASITPKVQVGANANIGAGSIVIGRVKAGHTVFGVPAKTIFKPNELQAKVA